MNGLEKKHTLWVIGDSTLSCFADKYYYPRYGYGTMLKEYLDESEILHFQEEAAKVIQQSLNISSY